MSDENTEKPVSWWSSFDHVVPGARMGARRLQADREAKFDNKYWRNRPHEQQPHHQGGAGALEPGKDTEADGMSSATVELARAALRHRGRNTTMMLWNFSMAQHRI